jgi:hypothetical protein
MKILVLTPRFPPMPGGVSDYARQWVLALANTKNRPEVVVLTPANALPEDQYRVLRVPDRWGPFAWPRLLKAIQDEQPDVLSCTTSRICFRDAGSLSSSLHSY